MTDKTNDSPNPQSRPKRDFVKLKLNKETSEIKKDDKVTFKGEVRRRSDVVKQLKNLDSEERVCNFTDNRRIEVTTQLANFRKNNDLENGKAVFQEYKELLDDENSHDFADFWESDWINLNWLKQLALRKKEMNFWNDI